MNEPLNERRRISGPALLMRVALGMLALAAVVGYVALLAVAL
jgi:hypothetical protein